MATITTKNITTTYERGRIEGLSKYIKLTDTDDKCNLQTFCYNGVVDDSQEFTVNREYISGCRGVVFEGDKLIMKAFSYTPEYSASGTDLLDEFVRAGGGVDPDGGNIASVESGLEKCSIYEAHEGALIRMFCHNNTWFTTTHRKLNAFKSTWGGGVSYGAAFCKGLEHLASTSDAFRTRIGPVQGCESVLRRFQNSLVPTKQYMFLVRNTHENRLVCTAPSDPSIYHVGTFDACTCEPAPDADVDVHKPKKIDFTSMDDLYITVNKTPPQTSSGVIVFAPGNRQFKISSGNYLDLLAVRGNEQSVPFRYLMVRNHQHTNAMIRSMFPEHVARFDEYEKIIAEIAKDLTAKYTDRYIKKNRDNVPKDEFCIIRTAHDWYMGGKTRWVSLPVIIDVLGDTNPTIINRLIKKVKYGTKNPIPPVSIVKPLVAADDKEILEIPYVNGSDVEPVDTDAVSCPLGRCAV